ncbi:MAG TPA: hypothetical protein VFF70_12810, partial [Anaerolineae bacterium]|nr:hypothetical protein [Anaerolineae bacterium]
MFRTIERLALVFIAAIIIVLIAIGIVRGAPQSGVVGTGTALSCDEAAFDARLAGGGLITFNCGAAPVTITLSSEIPITATTVISGNGLITLSGNDATRLFNVGSGVTFSLVNLKITHGYASFDSGGAIVS